MKNNDHYSDGYDISSNSDFPHKISKYERDQIIRDISSSSKQAEKRKAKSLYRNGKHPRRKSKYGANNRNFHNRKIKSKKRKMWLIVLSVFIVSIVIFGGAVCLKLNNILNLPNYIDDGSSKMHTLPDEMEGELAYENGLLHDPRVLNILLFGSDKESRGDEVGGSDSIILVSLDTRRNTIKLTSIMRDLWLKIADGYGKHKLNYAYAAGQEALAVKTIENNFGIKIDRFVTVDFTKFVSIVDSIGGIDLDITGEEAETINRFCRIENMKVDKELDEVDGVHHLCGVQALNHARDRDTSGYDFGRTQRQRNVFSAMVQKVKSAGVTQLASFASQAFSNVTTNFKKGEITKFLTRVTKYLSYEIVQNRVPRDDEFTDQIIDEQMVLLLDNLDDTKERLANAIYEESYVSLPKPSKNAKIKLK